MHPQAVCTDIIEVMTQGMLCRHRESRSAPYMVALLMLDTLVRERP